MAYSKQHYKALDDLYDYMTGILEIYRDAIPMLKDELDAIINEDTEKLNLAMNSQQAVILKTRDFDERMAEFGKLIEVPNSSLRELAENLPAGEGKRFAKLHEDLKVTIEEVLFYRNKCREMLTAGMHKIERILEGSGNPQENTTYDSTASEVQTSLFPKSLEKKI